MCIICTEKYKIRQIRELYICNRVTSIPNIVGLKELFCENCPLLTSIPNIKGLKTLECYRCPSLTNIPNIEKLEKFYCAYCPLLTSVPGMVGLNLFYHTYCSSRSIPTPFACYNCKWLKYNNLEYENNLSNLIIMQKYFHKYKKINRMIKWVNSPSFNKWYYSPNQPGGKRTLLRIQKRLNL